MSTKNIFQLKKTIPIVYYSFSTDEIILVISGNNLLLCLFYLKYHINCQYKVLSCISGVDFLSVRYRFAVVYDLLSLTNNNRLRLKVFVNETTLLESATFVYINADWWEREIWDFFGIYFSNHNDLRRILTDYGFEGHPMRKDFPLSGYVELRYDQKKKLIVVEPIELSQEFRFFSFDMPWQQVS